MYLRYVKKRGGDGWQRPSEMLPVPILTNNNECYFLILVYENQINPINIVSPITAPTSTIVYTATDGTNVTQGSGVTFGKNFQWDDTPSSSYVPSLGCRQVLLKVAPLNPNSSLGFNMDAGFNGAGFSNVFGIYCNSVGMNSIRFGATTGQRPKNVREIYIKNITAASSLFAGMVRLEKLQIENTIQLPSVSSSIFSTNNLDLIDWSKYNFINVTNLSGFMISSNQSYFEPTTSTANVTNWQNAFNSSSVKRIVCDMSGATNVGGTFTNCYNLGLLRPIGLKISHNITTTGLYGEEAFLIYANSLGTANSGATIIMSVAQYNSFGGTGSTVYNKFVNDKGYIIIV